VTERPTKAQLESVFARQFDDSEAKRVAVARQAGDLLDSKQLIDDLGTQPTPEQLCEHLSDAPDGYTLAERWNWWIGSLELAFGGYLEFRVHGESE